MKKRTLGRTGLKVSPIALGGAPLGYVTQSSGWNPRSPEGRREALAMIHHAIDRGINYIDTAALYGDGFSEELIGEVMATRRDEVVLATKFWNKSDYETTIESVHASLRRLNTDHVDIIKVHGKWYGAAEVEHVLKGGPLDAMRKLKEEGKVRHLGLTGEETWSMMPFLAEPEIEVYQIAYNCIYQGPAMHFLPAAHEAGVGVEAMRAMTSGVLPVQARHLAPDCPPERLYEIALKFVLGDSRIHSALCGMRWVSEVDKNVELASSWEPPVDFATLPRLTKDVYADEDGQPRY